MSKKFKLALGVMTLVVALVFGKRDPGSGES